MAQIGVVQFRTQLAKMDQWLAKHRPDVLQALQRPATDKDMAALAAQFFGDMPIPPLIKAWFHWHNGQTLDGSAFFPGYKHSSFYLASIREALQARRDMNAVKKHGELSGPWSDHWLPLLMGEYGDILVFVTAGEGKNGIRACWHESPGREMVATHLAAFLARARRELAKGAEKPADAEPRIPRAESSVPSAWVKGSDRVLAGAPSETQLAHDTVGTAYLVGPFEMPVFYPAKGHYVAIKVGDDLWISVFDTSRDNALAAIRNAVIKVRKSKWAHTNAKIASELAAEHKIWKRKIRQRRVAFEG